MTAGLEHLGVLEATPGIKVVLITIITALATVSVVTGLDKGIAFPSRANLALAALFLVGVLILGPTLFILRDLIASIGNYVQNFVSLSFQTFPFYGEAGASWLAGWTTNYWAWWISWSPFVGVFIARISRGRTVREFLVGVLLVPTLMTIVWFSVLGGAALHREIFGGGGIIDDGAVDTDTALFDLLATMPGSALLSGIAITLVVIFFVTSADSGAFVVDMLANGGNPTPPVWSRVMWAVLSGSIAAVLIWAGANSSSDMPGANTVGMAALQALTLLAATPFSLVMVAMAFATVKALRADHAQWQAAQDRATRRELVRDTAERVLERPNG
nr:BCCT family transporter [Tessaracoccus flavus]